MFRESTAKSRGVSFGQNFGLTMLSLVQYEPFNHSLISLTWEDLLYRAPRLFRDVQSEWKGHLSEVIGKDCDPVVGIPAFPCIHESFQRSGLDLSRSRHFLSQARSAASRFDKTGVLPKKDSRAAMGDKIQFGPTRIPEARLHFHFLIALSRFSG